MSPESAGRETTRAWLAAVLSGLYPGTGQLLSGARRLGWILTTVTTLVVLPLGVIAVLVLFVTGPSLAVTVSRPFLDHPWLLIALLAVNGALAVYRIVAAVDAYRRAGGTAGAGWLRVVTVTVAATLVAVIVVAPHWWAASRNLALHDLATHDFVTDPAQSTSTTTSSQPTTTTVVATSATTSSVASTTVTTRATTTTSTTTTTVPATGRRNLLLLGGDAAPDRSGIRTDSMIVVSIDGASGETAFFGIPRNQVQYPIPAGHPAHDVFECHCYEGHSNSIYQFGLQHPELFPGGPNTGANAAMTLIGHLLGLEIHHFALVDLAGFVEVIDALGGITIDVGQRIIDETYTHPDGTEVEISIAPGIQHMDGETALAYARVRRHSDDYARMGRQRCVLEALAAKADAISLFQSLPGLVDGLQGSVLTDIPVADWPDFLDLAAGADTDAIVTVRFIPNAPELAGTGRSYVVGVDAKGFWIPDVPAIRDTVATVLGEPARQVIASLGLESLDTVCG